MKETNLQKILSIAILLLMIALFIVLAQPVWRGREMAEQFKSDCYKRGGVLLEHKGLFGINYKCTSRLD